jgi:NAD/NADP transhydrogenase beta subunit
MKNSESLIKRTVYTLISLSIVTFFTAFLQQTKFEFLTYIFYLLLLAGGIKLIILSLRSNLNKIPKLCLLLTGFTLTIYFLFFLFAFTHSIFSGSHITETMTSVESILYLNSLFVLIGFATSLISLRKVVLKFTP